MNNEIDEKNVEELENKLKHSTKYDESDIQVLEGLEPVRKRRGIVILTRAGRAFYNITTINKTPGRPNCAELYTGICDYRLLWWVQPGCERGSGNTYNLFHVYAL